VIVDVVPFAILALIAVLTALAMITSRNTVHAALLLVINFGTIAVLYLALNAPFLAMVQIAVYAGAIMVLFLFVIMLLGPDPLGSASGLRWQRPLSVVLSLALLAVGGYLFVEHIGNGSELQGAIVDSSPRAVGNLLFERYLLPFEITSVLLLTAMIGAIVLTLDKKEQGK
jgi:NADH-quinone oxidoreductase subunit J